MDNSKALKVIMPMYNLIEYSDNYSKISGSLFQICREETPDNLMESESFKYLNQD